MEVRRELVVPSRREDVWAALTEAERLEQWFATEVELELEPGGAGRFRWGNGEEREAVVEAVEPEERLSFWWGDADDSTRVAFTLEDVPEGTRVTVTESGPAPQACAGDWSWGIELWTATLPTRSSGRSAIPIAVA
jgi:uncharacterized protein YndB with AHSA1/START domain